MDPDHHWTGRSAFGRPDVHGQIIVAAGVARTDQRLDIETGEDWNLYQEVGPALVAFRTPCHG